MPPFPHIPFPSPESRLSLLAPPPRFLLFLASGLELSPPYFCRAFLLLPNTSFVTGEELEETLGGRSNFFRNAGATEGGGGGPGGRRGGERNGGREASKDGVRERE